MYALVVGFGMLNESEVVLNFIADEKTLKLLAIELGSIIGHHGVQYPKMGENVSPNELPSLGSHDGG